MDRSGQFGISAAEVLADPECDLASNIQKVAGAERRSLRKKRPLRVQRDPARRSLHEQCSHLFGEDDLFT